MAKNTINISPFVFNRHSCMLLAGIHALKTRFPLRACGNDVVKDVFNGK